MLLSFCSPTCRKSYDELQVHWELGLRRCGCLASHALKEIDSVAAFSAVVLHALLGPCWRAMLRAYWDAVPCAMHQVFKFLHHERWGELHNNTLNMGRTRELEVGLPFCESDLPFSSLAPRRDPSSQSLR